MSIGIRANEFWDMNPRQLRPYVLANNLKLEQQNFFVWLEGYYHHMGTSIALKNAFSKKGSKVEKYPEEPIRITPLTEQEKLEKAEKEKQKAIDFFTRMEKSFLRKQQLEGDNDG